MSPEQPAILLFDGQCLLCNRFVNVLLRIDRKKRLLFCAAQSAAGERLKRAHALEALAAEGVCFIHGTDVQHAHKAVFAALKLLPAPWRWLRIAEALPDRLSSFIYRLIARNRLRWFGGSETCRVPRKDEVDRFLVG